MNIDWHDFVWEGYGVHLAKKQKQKQKPRWHLTFIVTLHQLVYFQFCFNIYQLCTIKKVFILHSVSSFLSFSVLQGIRNTLWALRFQH